MASLSYKHYWICLFVETFGVLCCIAALMEMIYLKLGNPACVLTTAGSTIGFIGSTYFAKIVKWKRAKKECSTCDRGRSIFHDLD